MTDSQLLPQVVAAFAATLGAFAYGTAISWSSAALPSLENCNGTCDLPFELTEDEGSWMTSFLFVGASVASPFVGQFMLPVIGCRWSMIALSVPFALGWTCMLIAKPLQITTPALFYVARIIIGFSGGAFTFVGPTYIAETAEIKYRGAFSSLMQLMITGGIAFVNGLAIHNALEWFHISVICLVLPGLVFIAMLLMPDTPSYLIRKGRYEAAKQSLQRLRGKNYSGLEAELDTISENVNNMANGGHDEDAAEVSSSGGISISSAISNKELFTSSVYLKPLAIASTILFIQQFSGATTVSLYSREIFIKADTGMDTGLGAFLVMLAQVVSTIVSIFVVERLGRKVLLMTSIAMDCLAITGLGLYFYLDENSGGDIGGLVSRETMESLSWLPLVCLVIFMLALSLGLGPVAWTLNVELYPREAQSVMPSVSTGLCWSFAFLIGKFGTDIEAEINQSGLFFLNGAVCLLGLFFCALVVPETKGKSPEDMKDYFQNGRFLGLSNSSCHDVGSVASVAPIIKNQHQ